MRSRWWFWVTVLLISAMVVALGSALVAGAGAGDASGTADDTAPVSEPTSTRPTDSGSFELRQVLFQETGQIQLKPPLRPGPAEGGRRATRDLLRVDCALEPRPMKDDDNVILCDVNEFRYGLGPSALPDAAVSSATASEAAGGGWGVTVQLDDTATESFERLTRDLSGFGPPLNQVAIVINGVVVAAPAVLAPIEGGQLQITGTFSEQEAAALAASLGA